MSTYKGIPFNGGLDSPSGTGAQNIVETLQAICDWAVYLGDANFLYDQSNAVAANWDSRDLVAAGVGVVQWNSQQLYDSAGVIAADWTNRTLNNNAGNQTVQWQDYALFGASGFQSLDWSARALLDDDGATQQLVWNNGLFAPSLPTSDPHVVNQLWNDAGQVAISAG